MEVCEFLFSQASVGERFENGAFLFGADVEEFFKLPLFIGVNDRLGNLDRLEVCCGICQCGIFELL